MYKLARINPLYFSPEAILYFCSAFYFCEREKMFAKKTFFNKLVA